MRSSTIAAKPPSRAFGVLRSAGYPQMSTSAYAETASRWFVQHSQIMARLVSHGGGPEARVDATNARLKETAMLDVVELLDEGAQTLTMSRRVHSRAGNLGIATRDLILTYRKHRSVATRARC